MAFSFALFGSGLGWLAALFGLFTADFWVAEGFPFLASYANPHFPIGIAIMTWIITPNQMRYKKIKDVSKYLPEIVWLFSAIILALIIPFGVVISGIVLGGYGFWKYFCGPFSKSGAGKKNSKFIPVLRDVDSWWKLLFVIIGGLPVMLYQLWLTRSNPELAAWNAQNLTVSPAIWDLIISYSPIILLALPGGYLAWKSANSKAKILLIWAVGGIMLMYLPWGLQRRFILGYLIPLAGLAAIGLDHLFERNRRFSLALAFLMLLLILPTNIMILIGGIQAVNSREPKIVLHQEEAAALNWISANTSRNALVIASPQMGLYIPAYTGRKVVYGHPFETINASRMLTIVEEFFVGQMDIEHLPDVEGASYIFYGPRERELGRNWLNGEFEIVYSSELVTIFETNRIERFSSLENIQR